MCAERSIMALAALLLLSASAGGADALRDGRPPNVVILYADDLGSIDLNCYGAKDLATPNLDALAQRGVRFTQFYSAAPICSASRASLLTGRYPQRAGVPGNVGCAPGDVGMPAQQVTIAEMLKAAGYATAHVGKWHLGYTPETMPNNQGFDFSFGHMGGCIDNYSHFFYWDGPNRHDLWRNGSEEWRPGQFFAEAMVDEASAFLESHRDQPMFLYFALNMPHYPYQGYEKWLRHYQGLPYPRNLYAAFVSTLDENVGRLLAKLDELGLRDRTIVLFQSDNGHSTEDRAHSAGGNAGPYRGAKFSLFEGGIRMPAIIAWPGTLPENQVRDQMATACDWMPTIADLCNVPLPASTIDGKSLTEVLRAAAAPSPHGVFHWQTYPAAKPAWAVREGPWKLLGNPRDTSANAPADKLDDLFLVNLDDDVGETRNVAAEHPDIVERLQSLHNAWATEVTSP